MLVQHLDLDKLIDTARELIVRNESDSTTQSSKLSLIAQIERALDNAEAHPHALLYLRWLRIGLISQLDYSDLEHARERLLTTAIRDQTHILRSIAATSLGGMAQPEGIEAGAVADFLQDTLHFCGYSPIDRLPDLARNIQAALALCRRSGTLKPAVLADCYLATAASVAAQKRLLNLALPFQEVIGDTFAIASQPASNSSDYDIELLQEAWLARSEPGLDELPAGTKNLILALNTSLHAFASQAESAAHALHLVCVWIQAIEPLSRQVEDEADTRRLINYCRDALSQAVQELLPGLATTDLFNAGLQSIPRLPESVWQREGGPRPAPEDATPDLNQYLDWIAVTSISELIAERILSDEPVMQGWQPPGYHGDAATAISRALKEIHARGLLNLSYVKAGLEVIHQKGTRLGLNEAHTRALLDYVAHLDPVWSTLVTCKVSLIQHALGHPLREVIGPFADDAFIAATCRVPYLLVDLSTMTSGIARGTHLDDAGHVADVLDSIRTHLSERQQHALAACVALRLGQAIQKLRPGSAELASLAASIAPHRDDISLLYGHDRSEVDELLANWLGEELDLPRDRRMARIAAWLEDPAASEPAPNDEELQYLADQDAQVTLLHVLSDPRLGTLDDAHLGMARSAVSALLESPPAGPRVVQTFYPHLARPEIAARLGITTAERISVARHSVSCLPQTSSGETARRAIWLVDMLRDLLDGASWAAKANELHEEVAARYLSMLEASDLESPSVRWFIVLRARWFLNFDGGSRRKRLWRCSLLFLTYLRSLELRHDDLCCNAAAALSEYFRLGSTQSPPTSDLWWEIYLSHVADGALQDPDFVDFHEHMRRNRAEGFV